MRLVECDIAGFGRFKDTHIDFNEGLNASIEENGWGKTTLLVFIKAMLFGMEFSRKRTQLSEREHYSPWDTDKYGGALVIDIDGRLYRIERMFGKKNGEDKFTLYDVSSGLNSDDYTENIGQEIFEVDRASFERSVFLPQSALETAMTDSINAKMGDMSQAQDDINNFDDAIKSLEEAKRVYTKNSKLDPGKLLFVRAEIRKCKEALEQIPAQADALEKQRKVLEEKRDALFEETKKKASLQEEITAQSKREHQRGAYKEKKETYEKLLVQIEEAKSFFGKKLPEREDIDELDECERQLELNQKQYETIMQTMPKDGVKAKYIKLFESGIPDDEKMNEWDEKAQSILALRIKSEHSKLSEEDGTRLVELKSYFSKKNPTDEELKKALSDATELAALEGKVDALDEQYRNISAKNAAAGIDRREAGRPSAKLYGWLLVVILIIGGMAFGLLLDSAWGFVLNAIFVAAGIAVAVLMVSSTKRSKREREGRFASMQREEDEAREALDRMKQELLEKKNECLDFLDGYYVSASDNYVQMIGEIQRKKEVYDNLLAQEENMVSSSEGALDDLAALQVELYTTLTPYALVYGIDLYDEHKESELIDNIREDVKEYDSYLKSEGKLRELDENIKNANHKIENFLKSFDTEEASVKERLLEIRRRLDHYNTDREEIAEIEKEIKEFEKNNNIDDKTQSVEELQKEQEETDARISDLNEQIIKANETLTDITDVLEDLEETGDNLPHLMELEGQYKEKVALYDDTLEYLTRAKEAFLARYMGPLRKGLTKYVAKLTDLDDAAIPANSFTVDMDLGVKLIRDGSTRSDEYLSSGYKDMLFVCARLALLDVMYGKNRPFIILDDPFCNLDEKKLKKAMELLKDISGERQVIYYTCHASRMP